MTAQALLDSVCKQLTRVLENKSSTLKDFRDATQEVVNQIKEENGASSLPTVSDLEFDKLLNEVTQTSGTKKENEKKVGGNESNPTMGSTSLINEIENISKIFSMFVSNVDADDLVVTCDKHHKLVHMPYEELGYSGQDWFCDACKRVQVGKPSYHCSICNPDRGGWDLCRQCYADRKEDLRQKKAALEQQRLEEMEEKNNNKNKNGGDKISLVTCSNGHVIDGETTVKELTQQHNGYRKGYQCHACNLLFLKGQKSFHCRRCFYDLCKDCFAKARRGEIQTVPMPEKKTKTADTVTTGGDGDSKDDSKEEKEKEKEQEEKSRDVTCKNGHTLEKVDSTSNGYGCDGGCDGDFDEEEMAYICEADDFYVCKHCFNSKQLLLNGKVDLQVRCDNGHTLIKHSGRELRDNNFEKEYDCNFCESDECQRSKGAYICFSCEEYCMCPECHDEIMGKLKKDYKTQTSKNGMTEKDYALANEFAVCKSGHQLLYTTKQQLAKENDGYAEGFGCDDCNSLQNGASYHCDRCERGFDLCKNCFKKRITNGEKELNGEDIEESGDGDDDNDSNEDEDRKDDPEALRMFELLKTGKYVCNCDECQDGETILKLVKIDKDMADEDKPSHWRCSDCEKLFKFSQKGYCCEAGELLYCTDCIDVVQVENLFGLCRVSPTLGRKILAETTMNINVTRSDGSTIVSSLYFMEDDDDDEIGEDRQKLLRFLVRYGGYCGNYQTPKIDGNDDDDTDAAETKNNNDDYGDDGDSSDSSEEGYYDEEDDDDDYSDEDDEYEDVDDNGKEDLNDVEKQKEQEKEEEFISNFQETVEDTGKQTMLHLLCMELKDIGFIKRLIENGSSVSIANEKGFCCIYYAIFNGNVEFVKFLTYVLTTRAKNVSQMIKLMQFKESIALCRSRGFNDMRTYLITLQSALKTGGSTLKTVRDMIGDEGQRAKDKIISKVLDIQRQEQESLLLMSELDNTTKASICECVMHLLKKKSIVSQDLLLFCLHYLTRNGRSDNDKKRFDKLIDIFKRTVRKSLTLSNPCKKRDHIWFKKYLLKSNIFFIRNEKGDLLFDEICQLVNVELKSQQRYLKDEFLKYNNDKDDGKYFEQVLNYKEWTDKSQVGDNAGLRQDAIDDGVVATVRKSSLFVSRDTGFDGREAYDLRVYLTNVLIRAHAVNETFQSDMKSIFENEIKCGKYSRAPVKLAERCQIKASTDYGNRKWPTTSCIVDLIRCSIAFTSAREMILSMDKFSEMVKKGKCGSIKKIVRVKNMFSQFGSDKLKGKLEDVALNRFSYCDIKFNAIIRVKGKPIIGEIQFLIKFMTKAKKMGHSLYNIVRQEEFVEDVTKLMEKEKGQNVNAMLSKLIVQKDFSGFSNQMILSPSRMLYLAKDKQRPVLYSLLKSDWKPAIELFCHSMIYFDDTHQLNKQFITKYLAHPMLKEFKDHPMVKKMQS